MIQNVVQDIVKHPETITGVKIVHPLRNKQFKWVERHIQYQLHPHPNRVHHVIAVWDNKPTMRQGVVDGTEIVIK